MGAGVRERRCGTLPAKPARVAVVADGLHGTHKSGWECDTGIACLVSGVPGWRTSRMGTK